MTAWFRFRSYMIEGQLCGFCRVGGRGSMFCWGKKRRIQTIKKMFTPFSVEMVKLFSLSLSVAFSPIAVTVFFIYYFLHYYKTSCKRKVNCFKERKKMSSVTPHLCSILCCGLCPCKQSSNIFSSSLSLLFRKYHLH